MSNGCEAELSVTPRRLPSMTLRSQHHPLHTSEDVYAISFLGTLPVHLGMFWAFTYCHNWKGAFVGPVAAWLALLLFIPFLQAASPAYMRMVMFGDTGLPTRNGHAVNDCGIRL